MFGGGDLEEEKVRRGPSLFDEASKSMKELADQSASLLGYREKSQLELLEDEVCGCCPELTYSQRITGYCILLFFSFLLSIGAATRLTDLLLGDPVPFAIFYSAENVVAICSSLFLSGPYNQYKRMCDSSRYIATSIYFFSIFATIFFCFYQEGIPPVVTLVLILFLLFMQWCALIWYTLSYIPFVRDYLLSCCFDCCRESSCCCSDEAAVQ